MSRVFLICLACVLALFTAPVMADVAPTNTATITGSVIDTTGKPLANAQVVIIGPKHAQARTNAQGYFIFSGVPFGQYQISTTVAGLGTSIRSLTITGDIIISIEFDASAANIRTIGSVHVNAAFNVTPASVTQINPAQVALEGETSWRRIIEQIPGVTAAGLGSGATISSAIPNSPLSAIQVSVNGALPYETATLLDDMPLAGGGLFGSVGTGTDLGLLPMNGFASADVVRGPGASSPSIMDSIGGSLILHAPGAVSKNHYALSLSTDPYGGESGNGVVAERFGKLSMVGSYGLNNSVGPNPGKTFPLLTNFSAPMTVDGVAFTPYSPNCPPATCQFGQFLVAPGYSSQVFPEYGIVTGLLVCCVDRSVPWTQHSGSLALTYSLSPSINATLYYAAQKSTGFLNNNYGTLLFLPPAGYMGAQKVGPYVVPFDSALASISGTSGSNILEEKITAQIGSGIIRIAALQNRTFYQDLILPPADGIFSLYGAGYLNGVLSFFNGGPDKLIFATPTDEVDLTGSNNRDILVSYTAPVTASVNAGLSFVRSTYNYVQESTQSQGGITTFTIGNTTSISQKTDEARFFVSTNPWRNTSLDLSQYIVHTNYHVPDPNNAVPYYTAGANLNYIDLGFWYAAPRLGLVWRPSPPLAVRVAAGSGLAAAPLTDMIGSAIPQFAGTYYIETPPNVAIKPEKSFGFDVGTDIRIRGDVIASFDVYRATMHGQLYQTTLLNGMFNGSSGLLPLYTQKFINLALSRFEGALLDIRDNRPKGVYWRLSTGLTRGYVVSLPDDFYNVAGATCNLHTGDNCTNLNVIPGENFNGTYTAGAGGFASGASIPYAQGLGTVGYRWRPEKFVDLTATYYGNNNSFFRPAFVEFDAGAGYPIGKDASASLIFRNITGVYGGSVQFIDPSNMTGAATLVGPPYVQYGQEFGPRSWQFLVTLHN